MFTRKALSTMMSKTIQPSQRLMTTSSARASQQEWWALAADWQPVQPSSMALSSSFAVRVPSFELASGAAKQAWRDHMFLIIQSAGLGLLFSLMVAKQQHEKLPQL